MTIAEPFIGAITAAHELTPEVDSRVFDGHANAHFYLGVLATPGYVPLPTEWQAARRLRANVYIDEKHFLPATARENDGGESDSDDQRSAHFGVLENQGDIVRMVGTSRLIIKGDDGVPLPVERLFPEAFEGQSAPPNSLEVSRFIARHEDKRLTQRAISLGLIRAMVAWSLTNSLQPAYAVMERPLTGLLDRIQLPYEVIGEPRKLEEYNNTTNRAVRIDPNRIIASVRPENQGSDVMRLFFAHTLQHLGLGYFDQTLTEVR